jgi:RNA 2',3'-cyclic 3'-phosphodiesterase
VPEEARDDLQRQLEPYRLAYPDVRWTDPRSWHLTLLFLGQVEPRWVGDLSRLMDEVAAQLPPYRATVAQGGGRPRHQGGVAWLGLTDGAGALSEAAALLAAGCPPDVTEGGRPPKRTPSAHLTVARRVDERVIEALREQTHGPIGTGWEVDRMALLRSHLGPAGARYETLRQSTM